MISAIQEAEVVVLKDRVAVDNSRTPNILPKLWVQITSPVKVHAGEPPSRFTPLYNNPAALGPGQSRLPVLPIQRPYGNATSIRSVCLSGSPVEIPQW